MRIFMKHYTSQASENAISVEVGLQLRSSAMAVAIRRDFEARLSRDRAMIRRAVAMSSISGVLGA